jgi:protein SCO1
MLGIRSADGRKTLRPPALEVPVKRQFLSILFVGTLPLLLTAAARAEDAMSDHCAQKPKPTSVERSQADYALPDVTLVDQTGRPVKLNELVGERRPVALNFIFTTCTTICPVMTATFSQMRRELGPDAERVRLVSISIDPEHDTSTVLARYAERFKARGDWSFLTGSREDVERVERAFDAYAGSKVNHRPLTFLRRPGGREWVRLEGLGSGSALAEEVRSLL